MFVLSRIKIKNLALIKDLTLDFTEGFNVLLGETGAGKSIILDAIDFALGSKADKNLISYGENMMRVEACFDGYNQNVSCQLDTLEIEDEGLIVITRTLNMDGKSNIKINGNTVTLNMLKSLSTYLADSYSQHENLMLLKEKNQLMILDSFLEDNLEQQKNELKTLFLKRADIKQQIEQIGGTKEGREREIEFTKYQIDEIVDVNPSVEDEKQLEERLNILSSSEKITTNLEQAYICLNTNMSALNQIKTAEKNIGSISNYSDAYNDIFVRLNSVYYEIDDIATTIKNEIDNVKFDERELEKVDNRLDKYKNLKRKYGISVEAVLDKLETLKQKYDMLVNSDELLVKLNRQIGELENLIAGVCEKITLLRKETAKNLEIALKKEFKELGMKNAEFWVNFNTITANHNGCDDVQFLFSANVGEVAKPLSKIISGGEMSRFMLAYKNLNVKDNSTMIFDEIDSGISGEIGSAVAKKIANISKGNQVICISHLPQVCAMADNFYYVFKTVNQNKTESSVKKLDNEEIALKLAKLSGGNENLTDEAIVYAKQLLKWAKDYKANA